eukprot:4304505-Prymnesium_polylepis.1
MLLVLFLLVLLLVVVVVRIALGAVRTRGAPRAPTATAVLPYLETGGVGVRPAVREEASERAGRGGGGVSWEGGGGVSWGAGLGEGIAGGGGAGDQGAQGFGSAPRSGRAQWRRRRRRRRATARAARECGWRGRRITRGTTQRSEGSMSAPSPAHRRVLSALDGRAAVVWRACGRSHRREAPHLDSGRG